MAHKCKVCGETCYCNADIDDVLTEDTAEEYACRHYEDCEPDEPKVGEPCK